MSCGGVASYWNGAATVGPRSGDDLGRWGCDRRKTDALARRETLMSEPRRVDARGSSITAASIYIARLCVGAL